MEWEFEPGHTAVEFRCRHMMVTWVRGHFKNVSGKLSFNPADPRSAFTEVEIDASSLWTGDPARDAHLMSSDFLGAEQHPMIRFRSRIVELLAPTELRVDGDLTIRGVTKPVTLDVEVLGTMAGARGQVAGFDARGRINRKDFGVNWNRALDQGGVVLGDDVDIVIQVEALKKAPQPATPAAETPKKS
jgi:polyisoprenoid-binding protein YceI